jgi:localization factor PodJL
MPALLPLDQAEELSQPVPLTAGIEEAKSKMPSVTILQLQEAAGRGDAMAQFELAVAYEKGFLVDKDVAWAARWYGQAALQGHSEAQYKYANLKLAGLGEQQDLGGAYRWLTIASRQGHDKADEARAHLELRLAIDTLYQEQARVEAFTPASSVSPSDPPAVEYVQRKLAEFGYDPGPPDGFMGPRTVTALKNYKRERGFLTTAPLSEDILETMRTESRADSR